MVPQFAEVELAGTDFAKAGYLGNLLAKARLTPAELDRAITAMAAIDSDFELRQALARAFDSQEFDEARFFRLLEVASTIESDFERGELLLPLVDRLPDSPAAHEAWLAAASKVGSDFELGRVLARALETELGDAAFTARVLATASERMGSDFELRQTMERSRKRWSEPLVAAAYLDGVEKLGFKMADVKILTATHAHGDHVAGLAALKRLTGAQMMMSEADAALLEDGGISDFRFGDGRTPSFEAVKVDRRLKDQDTIVLGGVGGSKGGIFFDPSVDIACRSRSGDRHDLAAVGELRD